MINDGYHLVHMLCCILYSTELLKAQSLRMDSSYSTPPGRWGRLIVVFFFLRACKQSAKGYLTFGCTKVKGILGIRSWGWDVTNTERFLIKVAF